MSDMVPTGSKYTDDVRREAAVQYAITGSLSAITKAMDIPQQTLSSWKKTDWWEGLVSEVRSAKADEHIANYTRLVDEGQRIALEKLPEASARDAMIISATATDKARLLLNQPTTISGKSAGLEDLANRFRAIERDHNNINHSIIKTVEKGPKE